MLWALPAGIIGLYVLSKQKIFLNTFFSPEATKDAAANGNSWLGLIISSIGAVSPMSSSIELAALQQAKQDLISTEGRVSVVYLDSLKIPTGGIGHKITVFDGLKVGDAISNEKIDSWFDSDVQKAFNAAKAQAKELNVYSVDMIAALTSVNFQLGTGWRGKFANTWKDLKEGDVESAVFRLKQSAWYKQTPTRVSMFIEAIQTNIG